jgi:3-carboxy-cis,cis-muconate cycloisomerase
MIPREAADATTAACRIERLDLGRIREGIARTSHPLMPLIVELSGVVGEPHGGWVHWGVTLRIIWHKILLDIWHSDEAFGRPSQIWL